MQSLYTVLIRPVVTEKSQKGQADSKYTFLVNPDATKVDVQNAIEKLYGAEVDSVRVVPVRKKQRLIGRTKVHTKRQAGKKAVVTLKAGKTIDVMKMQEEKKTAKKTTKKES